MLILQFFHLSSVEKTIVRLLFRVFVRCRRHRPGRRQAVGAMNHSENAHNGVKTVPWRPQDQAKTFGVIKFCLSVRSVLAWSFIWLFLCLLICLLVRLINSSCVHLFVRSCGRLFVCLCVRLLVRLCVCLLVLSFVRAFVIVFAVRVGIKHLTHWAKVKTVMIKSKQFQEDQKYLWVPHEKTFESFVCSFGTGSLVHSFVCLFVRLSVCSFHYLIVRLLFRIFSRCRLRRPRRCEVLPVLEAVSQSGNSHHDVKAIARRRQVPQRSLHKALK